MFRLVVLHTDLLPPRQCWTNHGVLGLALLSSRGTSSSLYFNSSTPVRYPTLVLYIKQNIIVTLRTTVF